MSDKKLCTCEPNWICENCQTIEKLQQEVARLKNKIINLGDMIKVSDIQKWCEVKRGRLLKNYEYDLGYNQMIADTLTKFCGVKE